ncbi:MAG: secretin N-terminal domain-containing protein [Cyanobacteriota bacterium]
MNKKIFFAMVLFLISANINFIFAQDRLLTHEQDSNLISLDIKGMDILDLLKMLALRANLNIVVGKNVSGHVTMFLKGVSAFDALEMVLASNNLAYVLDKKTNITNIMTLGDYEQIYGKKYKDNRQLYNVKLNYMKAQIVSQTLNQVKSEMGRIIVDESTNTLIIFDLPETIDSMKNLIIDMDQPLATKIIQLDYAQADKLANVVQDMLTKNIGILKTDTRTNKLIITDYPNKISEITKIITSFDEKTKQVLIDAMIVEVKPSDKFEMGIDWEYWLKKNIRLSGSFAIPTLSVAKVVGGILADSTTENVKFKGLIDILSTIGDVKVLSSPRLVVMDNQEAKILVGTKDAYITQVMSQSGTGTTISAETVNFVDVGIKLFVTPTINKQGFVTMKIKPEVSSAETKSIKSGDRISDIPIVSTSEAETIVAVKDGVTLIIAGLKKDEKSKTVKKIPVLGDIPGLGFIFRRISESTRKTELVIFITPHIVSGDEPFGYTSLTGDMDIVQMQKMSQWTARNTIKIDFKNLKEYSNFIIERIQKVASTELTQGLKGEVVVNFILQSDGRLKGEPQIISSTNNSLDKLAINCVKEVEFPSFPDFVNPSELQFTFTLVWQ